MVQILEISNQSQRAKQEIHLIKRVERRDEVGDAEHQHSQVVKEEELVDQVSLGPVAIVKELTLISAKGSALVIPPL